MTKKKKQKCLQENSWSSSGYNAVQSAVCLTRSSVTKILQRVFLIYFQRSYFSAETRLSASLLQNIAVTYMGMYIGGDYVFEKFNFIGINVR